MLQGKSEQGQASEKSTKPLHKPIFTGDYDAFSAFDREAVRSLVRRIESRFKRIAEIGSWTGNGSTKTIVEEIRDGGGLLCCVDHWRGNPGVKRHQDLVSEFDMYATFRFNVSSFGGNECVRPLVMASGDAAEIVRDGFFDLVFIDGDHSYEATLSDIDSWLPKVARGGVLCGHDCEGRPGGTQQRSRLWTHRSADTIEGNGDFARIHPGVILAVDEKFGRSAHLWAEESITLEDGRVGRSTIWDVSIGRS